MRLHFHSAGIITCVVNRRFRCYAENGEKLSLAKEINVDDMKGLSYFFLGLGIGVAAGMILAPQSGPETREQIRGKAQEGGEYLRRRGTELKESATGLVDKGKDLLHNQRDQVSSALDAGKQAYRDTVGEAKQAGKQAASDITDAAQGI